MFKINGCTLSGPGHLLESRSESIVPMSWVEKEIGAMDKYMLISREYTSIVKNGLK